MPNLTLSFEVFCAGCGAGLCNQTEAEDATSWRQARVKVEPCKVCLSAEHEEGREEGKAEALNAQK